MTQLRLFQSLVVLSMFTYIGWFFLPYLNVEVDQEVRNLLRANGWGGSPLFSQSWFYGFVFIFRVVTAISLFFLLSWGRWLLAFFFAIDFLSIVFGGVVVLLPLDLLVLVVLSMLDAAVITMSFSGPVGSAFKAMRRMQKMAGPRQGL
ncbi:hypothetical protein ACG02S_26180 [Roseateles sp. DC23W]|uniref:Uncharacterized protein n=1 Tax=Pelomonas dachongensis TaxID=3299029 RepID=A0ABW7EXN6_9BURK